MVNLMLAVSMGSAPVSVAPSIAGGADEDLGTGFYDQAHFANVFRRAFGMTPGAFQGRRG